MSAEFYVGYLPQAPPRQARHTRSIVLALLVAAPLLGLVFSMAQGPFAPAVFEFGVERELRGLLSADPVPSLLVPRPGGAGPARVLLVGFGKHGAPAPVAGMDGRTVRAVGSLVYHDGRTMLEVVTVETIVDAELEARLAAGRGGAVSLGEQTLVGEIVDSKCHLGVMVPGQAKTHRMCATLCIRGGIPPILLVQDLEGRMQKLLLVGRDGRALNQELLEMVADTVEITGEVVRHDDLLVLKAEPASYKRLDG
jgi:hypothetical protein